MCGNGAVTSLMFPDRTEWVDKDPVDRSGDRRVVRGGSWASDQELRPRGLPLQLSSCVLRGNM